MSARGAFPDRQIAELVSAAEDGDGGRVTELVKAGVDVNGVGKEGVTPLLYAMSRNDFAAAKLLLEQGADANKPADNRISPMTLAARLRETRYLELLLAHGGDPNAREASSSPEFLGTPATFIALMHNSEVCMRYLLDHGADINALDGTKSTLLLQAVDINKLFVIEELMNRGADPFIANRWNSTLAWKLQERGHLTAEYAEQRLKLIKMLEDRGVVFPVKGPGGK